MRGDFDKVIIDDFSDVKADWVMVVHDENLMPSEPLRVPSFVDEKKEAKVFLEKAVVLCNGPETEKKGRLRKREVVTGCGSLALQSLVLNDQAYLDILRKEIEDTFAQLRVHHDIFE